jgi:hypothetical protein
MQTRIEILKADEKAASVMADTDFLWPCRVACEE